MTDFTTNFNTIQFDGASFLVGAETVNVLWRNSDGNIFLASGTTVPTDATAGYGKGAMFFDTDATSTGSVFWVNEGSATSSKFVSVTAPTTITLAGDVTGDSDANTVAKINGATLGTTTATSGNVLTANGTNWATATPDAAGLVAKAGNQTIAGVKTFSDGIASDVTGNLTGDVTGDVTGNVTGTVSGNAGTVTNGVYTTDIGTKVKGIAHAVYSFATDGGDVGDIGLTTTVPDNAIVTHAWYDIITPFTSDDSATVSIGLPTDGAACIQADLAYDNAAYAAGGHNGVAVGTTATMVKTTAAREITLTVGTYALTAGVAHIYVEYIQSV